MALPAVYFESIGELPLYKIQKLDAAKKWSALCYKPLLERVWNQWGFGPRLKLTLILHVDRTQPCRTTFYLVLHDIKHTSWKTLIFRYSMKGKWNKCSDWLMPLTDSEISYSAGELLCQKSNESKNLPRNQLVGRGLWTAIMEPTSTARKSLQELGMWVLPSQLPSMWPQHKFGGRCWKHIRTEEKSDQEQKDVNAK